MMNVTDEMKNEFIKKIDNLKKQNSDDMKLLIAECVKKVAIPNGTKIEDKNGCAIIIYIQSISQYYHYEYIGYPVPVYVCKNITKKGNVNKREPERKIHHMSVIKIYE